MWYEGGMKPLLGMGCAVLAVCAVGFSAYRILVERMPDEIRGTRLVMEHDASYLPKAGMVRLENAGFSSMVHGLENRGKFFSLAECIVEARQKDILDDMLDRVDPQRSLRFHVICSASGAMKEIWLGDGGNGENAVLINRCMAVLGAYWLLRRYCDDEQLFFKWMRLSLRNRKTALLDASVEYLFPWLRPDREQYVHGRWISDIESVTYYCYPLEESGKSSLPSPFMYAVTSRKRFSSVSLEIRCSALKGALIDVEIKQDSQMIRAGRAVLIRIDGNDHGRSYSWNRRPGKMLPVRLPSMEIPEGGPPAMILQVPEDFRSCPEEEILPALIEECPCMSM